MKEPTYQLEQLNFNGPLDLLLHLIDKNKVDIYDIPIFEITKQYMAYIRNMQEQDLDVVSDFLVMAATLLDIKARMLLPREVDESGEEVDPREELVARLLEYKRYQYLAEQLASREDAAAKYLYRTGELPQAVKSYVPPVDLDALFHGVTMEELQRVFRDVLRRQETKTDAVRARFGTIQRERVSLGSRIGSLIQYARAHRRFSFRKMLEQSESRTEVVVTFLAMLELMKVGKITVRQERVDEDIEVEATEEIDRTDDIDLSLIEDA